MVFVIVSTIHLQNYVFLMLVKTWILKYLRTNETRYIKWQKTCNVNANWMQVFVTTNKDRMKINADVNANNRLTKK